MDEPTTALLSLGRQLREAGYRFTTPTPETHRRVLARQTDGSSNLADIFGWSRPFALNALPSPLLNLLDRAGCAERIGEDKLRSKVRFSTLGDLLFVHSAYPTTGADAVFFGPDTYRFVRAIRTGIASDSGFAPKRIVDIGAGSGAGGVFCATQFPGAQVILGDINAQALRFCEINAALNSVTHVRICHSDLLRQITETADLIISNPPYLVDPAARAYRHGGGDWGCALALRIVEESFEKLSGCGKLILYTGTPVIHGIDMFMAAARPMLERKMASYRYEEIDPDVFGEELSNPPYDRADRIAAVMLLVNAKG